MERELFQGTNLVVFTTNQDDPLEGRVFVWTKVGWYEREEGEQGDIAFTPVAKSEREFREMLDDQEESDLTQLDPRDEISRMVLQEFREQAPLVPESPELSNEPPFLEQDVS